VSVKILLSLLVIFEPEEKLHFPKAIQICRQLGIDVCPDGNRPAQSKHDLLSTWPRPEIVHDVAKLIGFAQFYSMYILLD
jgi:hypothetical protein